MVSIRVRKGFYKDLQAFREEVSFLVYKKAALQVSGGCLVFLWL